MFNANNYGYNPYGRFIPQQPIQPIETPQMQMSNRPTLNGKQVDGIDVVKAMDIPLDGSISYFPLADGSAIASKQIQGDGTSKITIYKPVKEESAKENIYLVPDDLEDIKDEINSLKKEIKALKKDKEEDE